MKEQKCPADASYAECLYYAANAFARQMTKMADDAFLPTGLSASYAVLMMTVNNHPGICPRDISQRMQLTPSTITRLIEKMEYRGYLERRSTGKFTEVYPTDAGQALVPVIQSAWKNLQAHYEGLLGPKEAHALVQRLTGAVAQLDAP